MRSMKPLYFILVCFLAGCSQRNNEKLNPKVMTLPAFNLLLTDSSTICDVSKAAEGHYTVLMYLNPDCPFSRQQTQTIIQNITSLQNAHFYLFTRRSLSALAKFYKHYDLGSYKNITVGRDYQSYFSKNFPVETVPWLVIYDKQKKIKKIIVGSTGISIIKELLQG